MRNILFPLAVLLAAGCSSTKTTAPFEYLDEQTAATITMVADPWIFSREGAPAQLDFVNLYALNVNRMGDHRKYLAVIKYWPAPEMTEAPTLELRVAGKEYIFEPIQASARALGIGQPLDKAAPRSAKAWFYAIDKAGLEAVSQAEHLSVRLAANGSAAVYTVWRDGRAALSEFAALAQDL